MEVNLEGYQVEEYLTLHEATCLILGGDPEQVSFIDYEAIKDLTHYSDIFGLLEADLSSLTYQEHQAPVPRIRDVDKPEVKIDNLQDWLEQLEDIFNGNTIPEIKKLTLQIIKPPEGFTYNLPDKGESRTLDPSNLPEGHPALMMIKGTSEFHPRDYQINQPAIKKWLKLKGIQSKYFEKYVDIENNKKNDPRKGFQVIKPLQTVPALYQALTDNNLIDKISVQAFNDAFTSEKGCITWTGTKQQLGYLIKELRSRSVITSNNHMVAATRVFKATHGNALEAGGLGSGASDLPDVRRPLMDGIIKQVIDS